MFAVAKEFSHLGYDIYFLYDASDTVRHNKTYKRLLFENSPLIDYIGLTSYKNLKKDLKKEGERRIIYKHKEIPQGMDFYTRTNNEVSINKTPNPDISVYASEVKSLVAADVDTVKKEDKSITLKLEDNEDILLDDKSKDEVKKNVKKIDYIDEHKVPSATNKQKNSKPKESKTHKAIMTRVTREGNVSVHDKYMREKEIKRIEKSIPEAPAKAKRKKDEE